MITLPRPSHYYPLLFLLCIFTAFIYQTVLDNELLHWDDYSYLITHTELHTLSLTNLQHIFSFYESNWTPIAWLSHMLAWQVFADSSTGHHAINLVLHIINVLLVFYFSIALLNHVPRFNSTTRLYIAYITALLYAIHPQHVEVIAWVSARKDVLSTTFILAALISYLSYLTTMEKKKLWGSIVLFTLACMTKPVMVTLPALLLLLDIYPLNRIKSPYQFWECLKEKSGYIIITLLIAYIAIEGHTQSDGLTSTAVISMVERLWNSIHSLYLYLFNFFIPLNLSTFYPLAIQFNLTETIYLLIIMIVAIYLVIKKSPFLLVTLLSLLITLSPVLGFIKFGWHGSADRFMYFPSLALCLFVATSLILGGQKIIKKSAVIFYTYFFIGLLLISFFSLLSLQQAKAWRNNFTLWSNASFAYPDNIFITKQLGNAYLEIGYYEKSRDIFGNMIKQLSTHKDNKNYALYHHLISDAHFGLARSYFNLKDYKKAEGFFFHLVNSYKEGELSVSHSKIFQYMGINYQYMGDKKRALLSFQKCLELEPDNSIAQQNIAELTATL